MPRLPHGSGSYAGIRILMYGKRLPASNMRGSIGVFRVDEEAELKAERPIALPALKRAKEELRGHPLFRARPGIPGSNRTTSYCTTAIQCDNCMMRASAT